MNHVEMDLVVVIAANAFNIIIVGILISRVPGWKLVERILGFVSTSLVLPLGVVMVVNLMDKRAAWFWGLPGLMI